MRYCWITNIQFFIRKQKRINFYTENSHHTSLQFADTN